MSSPLTGIGSIATRHVLAELADTYLQQFGQPFTVESIGGVDAVRRVQAGEPFDFVVLASSALDALISSGHLLSHGRIDFARSGVAVGVKAGAPRPDIASEAAVREAVLKAHRVGYSTGPSGVYLIRLFERWGVTNSLANRLVQAPPGVPVGTLIARGEVALGFQQLSELMHLPDVDVVGMLPPEIQVLTVFSAAVCRAGSRPEVTAALLSFLASPETDDAKRRHGMEPARAA
jgi:molybdate transport system substrate-binding protein